MSAKPPSESLLTLAPMVFLVKESLPRWQNYIDINGILCLIKYILQKKRLYIPPTKL